MGRGRFCADVTSCLTRACIDRQEHDPRALA
jgi:hypothetical protein